MADPDRHYSDDVPDEVTARVRALCIDLPDAYEKDAWAGTRWMVRKRTFAQVLGINIADDPTITALAFRSSGEELDVLRHAGPPFFTLPWGHSALGMELNAETDWGEVHELIVESFCTLAPKKLIALVDRPDS